MGRKKRNWHPDFIEYMKIIANHPNYKGMPQAFNMDNSINWVTAASSSLGKERMKWWENERKKQGISPEKGSLQKTAKAIHPFGEKPCQICGKKFSLSYIYPTKNLLKKIQKIFKIKFSELDDIDKIIRELQIQNGTTLLDKLRILFKIPITVKNNQNAMIGFIKKERISFLSPGVMSDAPDRFDGYHTYNRCCRHIQDTGRHKENLSKYGQDRRVYEFWADGDWKSADWLMQEFKKHGWSADHIGPISQGFCHRPKFSAMSLKKNIDKRDRLGFEDFKILLDDEKHGEQVVSWHTKDVWNRLKKYVKNEQDSILLGKIMRKNIHNVLFVLSQIKNAGHTDFLEKLLNPQYAYYSIKFKIIDFDKREYEIEKTSGTKKQYENNAKRYVRKSIESLDEYQKKINRKTKLWISNQIDEKIICILMYLEIKDFDTARKLLQELLQIFANHAEKEYLDKKIND